MAKKQALDDGRRTAVALTYTDGQRAPKVVAKGYGELADRIIERAKEAGVFVHDSPELVSLLMQVDLDSHIPPDLYRAVAEVLAFIYFLEHQSAGATTHFDEWLTARGVPAELR